jgi:AP endonuclease 1
MPGRRKAVEAPAEDSAASNLDNKKRKRGSIPQPSDAVVSSPRGRKRVKSEEAETSPVSTSKVSRKPKAEATLKVEEEVTIRPRGKGKAAEVEVKEEVEITIEPATTPIKKGRKKAIKNEESEDSAQESNSKAAKPTRKRKTAEEKAAEAMPLAARSVGLKMFVGAHTSIAKGVENAITNCVHIGGNAFACFLKSQRKWENPPLKDENRAAFHKGLVEHKIDATKHVVPHGSYLVNLANEDKEKSKQSYDAFIDDLRRCEALGIKYYNFHPGGAGQSPFNEAIARLANHLNRALSETKTVVPLLENMAGHGTLIGGRFSDLRDVIEQIKPEFKSRIGVCIDTCHTFAAGYDLRSPEAFKTTMDDFDKTVGMKYLKALHINDSKMPLGSHRDLHQNIGLGFLGLRAFHNVMNEPRFEGLPLILETPSEKPDPDDPKGKKMIEDKSIWAKEIKLLESLTDMDPEGAEFKTLENELSELGRKEREAHQATYDRLTLQKADKEKKKLSKEKEKGQKSLSDIFAPKIGAKTGANNVKPTAKSRAKAKKHKGDSENSSELSELSE